MVIFRVMLQAGLLIAGLWWCKVMVGRWREDYRELKTGDAVRRVVIIGLWVVTLAMMGWMGWFIWGLVAMNIRAWH